MILLALGKAIHSYLHCTLSKFQTSTSQISNTIILAFAIKMCNDSAGFNGLVLTLLKFRILPIFPVRPKQLPDNFERMNTIAIAPKEATRLISTQSLDTALSKYVPKVADSDVKISEKVSMYREKPVSKWIGPPILQSVKDKFLS